MIDLRVANEMLDPSSPTHKQNNKKNPNLQLNPVEYFQALRPIVWDEEDSDAGGSLRTVLHQLRIICLLSR